MAQVILNVLKTILNTGIKIAKAKRIISDKKDNLGKVIVSSILAIILLIFCFVEYVMKHPIELLKATFSKKDIEKVESIKENPEIRTDFMKYGIIEDVYIRKPIYTFDRELILYDEASYEGRAMKLLVEAKKHLGKPYVWGMQGPDTFDCSGFVYYSFKNSIGGMPYRTNCIGIWNEFVYQNIEKPRAGDLVFFQGTQPIIGASHIGIYIGNGKYIEANSSLGVVVSEMSSNWSRNHFMGYGRPKIFAEDTISETKTDNKHKPKKKKKRKKGEKNGKRI